MTKFAIIVYIVLACIVGLIVLLNVLTKIILHFKNKKN